MCTCVVTTNTLSIVDIEATLEKGPLLVSSFVCGNAVELKANDLLLSPQNSARLVGMSICSKSGQKCPIALLFCRNEEASLSPDSSMEDKEERDIPMGLALVAVCVEGERKESIRARDF